MMLLCAHFTLSDVANELEKNSHLVSNPALIHSQGLGIMSFLLNICKDILSSEKETPNLSGNLGTLNQHSASIHCVWLYEHMCMGV